MSSDSSATDPIPWPDSLTPAVLRLAEADGPADEAGVWSEPLWEILRDLGAPVWGIPGVFGEKGIERSDSLARYARIAEGSLTAAFVLTQHDAAVRRLLSSSEGEAAERSRGILREIAAGRAFVTVGLSQLTTSRRKGPRAVVASSRPTGGFVLQGVIPWVTAAERADVLVLGAATEDDQQVLVAVPVDRDGLTIAPAFPLAALQASVTTEVRCEGVEIRPDEVIAGPMPDVMANPRVAGTGGLETSALALGQARAAIEALDLERAARSELDEPVEALRDAWDQAWSEFSLTAFGSANAPTSAHVRARSNALALNATQAYLTARKGSGFLRSDPAQRWARQALFFLVWSCPSPVAQAQIRDMAGVCSLGP